MKCCAIRKLDAAAKYHRVAISSRQRRIAHITRNRRQYQARCKKQAPQAMAAARGAPAAPLSQSERLCAAGQ